MKATWELLDASAAFDQYRDEWDRLNADLCASNPYFDSRFIQNLIAYFPEAGLTLCVLKENGSVEGLLLVRQSRFGKWALYKPPQAQIAPVLVRNFSSVNTLLKSLPPTAIVVDFLSQDPEISILGASTPNHHAVTPYAHTVSVAIDGDFARYWQHRPKKLRQNVERRMRRVGDLGRQLVLRTVIDSSQMDAGVARYGEMESKGWKGQAGTAIHIDNEQGRFYADMLKDFSKTRQARIYELCFDDDVVAMRLAITSADMIVMLKTTYDESLSKLSPGRLLLYKVLEKEFEADSFSTIEFYTNANSDLRAWATDDRWIQHYMLFRNSLVARMHGAAAALRRK